MPDSGRICSCCCFLVVASAAAADWWTATPATLPLASSAGAGGHQAAAIDADLEVGDTGASIGMMEAAVAGVSAGALAFKSARESSRRNGADADADSDNAGRCRTGKNSRDSGPRPVTR